MVGLERAALPLIAEQDFGLTSQTAILSFLIPFGLVKAAMNFLAGRLADRIGRKKILTVGWLVGLPVPVLIMWAPTWGWIIFANVLLGVNQGLAWSMTIIMMIDLVGPRRRGLAMGLNESAGYVAVALSAWATTYIAARYHLRPEPFYLGIAFAAGGTLLSAIAVRETLGHTRLEAQEHSDDSPSPAQRSLREVFALTSWRDRTLFGCSQAGLVNNLNDGIAWGLFPLLFARANLSVQSIGLLVALYPATWGVVQIGTGVLSDRWGRKWLIAAGMGVQAIALLTFAAYTDFAIWIAAAILLGVGTAMVYPTLLAAISDAAHPTWRGTAVGVYRLWRDSGYVIGAILGGVLSDLWGIASAIQVVGLLTLASGLVVIWNVSGVRGSGLRR